MVITAKTIIRLHTDYTDYTIYRYYIETGFKTVLLFHKYTRKEGEGMSKYDYGFRFINDGEIHPPRKKAGLESKLFQANRLKSRKKKKR